MLVLAVMSVIFLVFLLVLVNAKKEQRSQISFCIQAGFTKTQIIQHLEAVNGHGTLSRSSIYRWIQRIWAGNLDVNDKARTGRPLRMTPARVAQLQQSLNTDKTSSVRELARQTGVAKSTVHKALRLQLRLKKRPAKWIPHLLNDFQKRRRVRMATQILGMMRRSPTLHTRIITGDESWFHCYDPESRERSKSWLARNEPCPQKVRREISVRKCMMVVFWDSQGVIMTQFFQRGLGIGGHVYL